MGIVYSALDPSIGRTVAIKTIRLSDVSDLDERERLHDRLFREAQSAGMLSHPNIVTIYDIAQEGDLAYIAMELVDGPTLEKLARSDPPDAAQVLNILHQTAAALDYAHKRGVIHRDIKPANIMLHESTMVKITDFGIAKVQSAQATQTATLTGTPNYMSPEHIQGQAIDGRSDQFSLAVIAYELLTGERPFTGESMPTILFKIVREAPAPPQSINPSLGWAIETVLKRALAKNPEERYKSCADFVRALENACNSSKGWKPLAPGAALSLPTVRDAAPIAVPKAKPAPAPVRPAITPVEPAIEPVQQERASKPLRIARILAMIIVAGGIVSALMIYGLQYFGGQDEPAPQTAQTAPAVETSGPKPSPTAVQPLPPATEPQGAPPEEKKEQPKEAAIAKKEPKPEAGDRPALLVTNPPGATVLVDSKPEMSCKTPCNITLPAGRHTLSASLIGYRRALRIFEVPKESEVVMNLERTTGTVFIRSEPAGASISINGESRTEKTPATLTLPTGSYRIEVSKPGFQNYVESIDVKDAVMTNLDVNWPSRASH